MKNVFISYLNVFLQSYTKKYFSHLPIFPLTASVKLLPLLPRLFNFWKLAKRATWGCALYYIDIFYVIFHGLLLIWSTVRCMRILAFPVENELTTSVNTWIWWFLLDQSWCVCFILNSCFEIAGSPDALGDEMVVGHSKFH